jgi:hypothetical protein
VRSKIVHGSELRDAERALVKDDEELRAVVRRLVRGVIFATVHSDIRLTASYLDTRLDKELLNAPAGLRGAWSDLPLGLKGASPRPRASGA